MSAGRDVEELLPEVTPERLDLYESLLAALAEAQLWMLLWHGEPGDHDARYGSMEVARHTYVPCVTSGRELVASDWNRNYEAVTGRDIAAVLYPDRCGLWLNPHAPGGGVGIPWLDLRRVADGLDRHPPGPLRITEPSVAAPDFYQLLTAEAARTAPLRSLRRGWVRPALGAPYLVIGLEVDEPAARSAGPVRGMMSRTTAAIPAGLTVATVGMADAYDPVAMWLRANTLPFYDRDHPAQPAPPAVAPLGPQGYGYPRPEPARYPNSPPGHGYGYPRPR